MKRMTLTLLVLFVLASAATAQEPKKKAPSPQKTQQEKQAISECVMMKGGKMFHYKDGKETAITNETKFHEMKVMPDGTCKMKNGKSMKLKEGECCDTTAAIHKDCQKMMMKKG